MNLIGSIIEIWRYPISSIGGERLTSVSLDLSGVSGDRKYALVDAANGVPAAPEKERRWRNALHLRSETVVGEVPAVFFPNGLSYSVDDPSLNGALSDYFGFSAAVATYDPAQARTGLRLAQNRHRLAPAHLLTTASLKRLAQLLNVPSVDSRRFRPTALIETIEDIGFVENEWTGKYLRLGTVEMTAREETTRCGMTLISQPGIDEDPEVLRNILRHNKRNLGTYCSIETPGTIAVGDNLLVPQARMMSL